MPQNPRVSHINAEGNRKTFSPSAPNRPRGSHGGNSSSGRSRTTLAEGKTTDKCVHPRDHEKNRHDVQQKPHENPNLRLQSIDDIPDGAVSSKSPKNHKSKGQHVNKSTAKSPPLLVRLCFNFHFGIEKPVIQSQVMFFQIRSWP